MMEENILVKCDVAEGHLWYLSYWKGGLWSYWNGHVPVGSLVDPYHLVGVSNYEFYAYGGWYEVWG